MSWTSGFINAFGSVGNFMNAITGTNASMDKSYKQQIGAMNAQNAYNTRMWNLQNEYNSPASQLARMREAGIDINPTSYALGTGNLSNVASNVSAESGFAGSGSPAGNPISMLMGLAQGVQGVKESRARVDNMEKQNQNLTGVIQSTKLENDIRRHNLKVAKETNTPVNSEPGPGQAITQAVSNAAPVGKAKAVWKWLTTNSTHFPWHEFE